MKIWEQLVADRGEEGEVTWRRPWACWGNSGPILAGSAWTACSPRSTSWSAYGSLGLPADLFADATDPVVGAWRARAAQEYPSDLRERPRQVRLTLLAALCWARTGEITDGLVELLIGIVHKIGTRAENLVEGELLADLRRVRGKEGILFRRAEAAVEHPDETVRRALYPVVSETTLRDLVKEAKANEGVFKTRVRRSRDNDPSRRADSGIDLR